jgi:hypothetical protein
MPSMSALWMAVEMRRAILFVNSLLEEMTALGGLARRSRNPFRTCMVSSYDRSSKVAQASSETPTGWFANHDWGNHLGAEAGPSGQGEFVLLDADGPGAIVHIWSATPSGTLRIYLAQDGTDNMPQAIAGAV